eukprot:5047923-Pleurochrysis_carterae.AAC.1
MDKLTGGHSLPPINEDFEVDFDSVPPETPKRKGKKKDPLEANVSTPTPQPCPSLYKIKESLRDEKDNRFR